MRISFEDAEKETHNPIDIYRDGIYKLTTRRYESLEEAKLNYCYTNGFIASQVEAKWRREANQNGSSI